MEGGSPSFTKSCQYTGSQDPMEEEVLSFLSRAEPSAVRRTPIPSVATASFAQVNFPYTLVEYWWQMSPQDSLGDRLEKIKLKVVAQ